MKLPKTRKALRENTCKIFSAARNRRRTAEEKRTANVRFWKNQKKFFSKAEKICFEEVEKIFRMCYTVIGDRGLSAPRTMKTI